MLVFHGKCASFVCRDFVPKVDSDLINRSPALVNCFELLGGIVMMCDDVSSLCVPPRLFDRGLLQPALSDMGALVVTCVHFDVSGTALSMGDDSVRVGSRL